MKTIITKKLQQARIDELKIGTIQHKWSSRGYGRSYLLNRIGDQVAMASGCGYDRRGAAFGSLVTEFMQPELLLLAKKVCKPAKRGDRWVRSDRFYGLTLDREKNRANVDGACGLESVQRVLGAIGFSLIWRGESKNGSNAGVEFYTVEPINKRDRGWYLRK